MIPVCPVCDKVMTLLYKDVRKRKLIYRCRICGYKEEEYLTDEENPRTDDTGDL